MRLLLLCLLGALCQGIQAQYYVLNLKDTVYADNQLLTKKAKISENAVLRFSSPDAFVHVISPGKGYFILGVKNRRAKPRQEFVLAVKEALIPPNEYHAAATRSLETEEGSVFADVYELKAFFRGELFLIDEARFEVPGKEFPLDSLHYFVLRHHLQDGWFTKRIPQEGQKIMIGRQTQQLGGHVFTNQEIQQSQLVYIDDEAGREESIGHFSLYFPDQTILREDLAQLYDAVGPLPAEKFFLEHAWPYVQLQYGKTQLLPLQNLIQGITKGTGN